MMTNKEIEKFHDAMSSNLRYCKKCGHSVIFLGIKDRIICNHCKHWIYINDKVEFQYKIKSAIHKESH